MKARVLVIAAVLLSVTRYSAAQDVMSSAHDDQMLIVPITHQIPCVSIQSQGARLLLSEDALRNLIQTISHPHTTEPERLALIAGNRAALIVRSISSASDVSGCHMVVFADEKSRIDASYLVGQLIESGHVEIIRDGSASGQPSIVIHDSNTRFGGIRDFRFTDGRTFFGYGRWVN